MELFFTFAVAVDFGHAVVNYLYTLSLSFIYRMRPCNIRLKFKSLKVA